MDISQTIAPRSDQLNADDLIGGPRTVTITEVRKGTVEQPVEIVLSEYGSGRPFKPGLSMRRVLIAGWGNESLTYIGRRLTIYRDESIMFGGQPAPGIRISAMSDLDGPLKVNLTVTRGKRAPFTVAPIIDNTDTVTAAITDLESAQSLPALKAAWDLAGKRGVQNHADVIAAKDAAKLHLTPKEA